MILIRMKFLTSKTTVPEFHTIELSIKDDIAQLTLNRPDSANAMNTQMAEEMLVVLTGPEAPAAAARCIVLTGTGSRAFCAGADLKERKGMTDTVWIQQHAVFETLGLALMDLQVPLIGAINGAAFGGGMEMTLACDFAYAANTARFALTETTLGILPGMCGTQYLPGAVGIRRAKEIILTGRPFNAQQGLQWGVINQVCEPDQLLDQVFDTAAAIAANGPIAVREAKRALNHAGRGGIKAGYRIELDAYSRVVPTADRREGILAFNEKRKPQFKGE